MNILEKLRGTEAPSLQKFSIYIPDKDKDQAPIVGLSAWIASAARVLTEINGGSTILPPSRGTWRDKNGDVLEDATVVVYSYIRDPEAFVDRFSEIAAFVHEFGKDAKQESVLVEMSEGHRAYFIDEDDYD